MAKDGKTKPADEAPAENPAAEGAGENPAAEPEKGKEQKKQLTRTELEALRRELHRRFH